MLLKGIYIVKNSKLTMLLLIACFALWGVVNNMSDNLVPAFQRIFTMDQSRAVLVQVAFYGAYAVLALFTSILVEEFSFRTGILIGLGVYVCGALLYIPACVRQSFDFYFIVIHGIKHSKTTSNATKIGARIEGFLYSLIDLPKVFIVEINRLLFSTFFFIKVTNMN